MSKNGIKANNSRQIVTENSDDTNKMLDLKLLIPSLNLTKPLYTALPELSDEQIIDAPPSTVIYNVNVPYSSSLRSLVKNGVASIPIAFPIIPDARYHTVALAGILILGFAVFSTCTYSLLGSYFSCSQ